MGGNRTGVSSSSPEPEIKARPARDAIAYRYAGAMGPDDLHHDRQTQSGSTGPHPLAAPEALENVRPIFHRDAGTAVLDADRPLGSDIDDHFSAWGRMREGILNKIAHGMQIQMIVPEATRIRSFGGSIILYRTRICEKSAWNG